MSDTETGKLTLKSNKLGLKTPLNQTGVRQSFSGGRSKLVTVVEVKKKHSYANAPVAEEKEMSEEQKHRLKVLQEAKKAEEEKKVRLAAEQKERDEEAARLAAEMAAKKAAEEAEAALMKEKEIAAETVSEQQKTAERIADSAQVKDKMSSAKEKEQPESSFAPKQKAEKKADEGKSKTSVNNTKVYTANRDFEKADKGNAKDGGRRFNNRNSSSDDDGFAGSRHGKMSGDEGSLSARFAKRRGTDERRRNNGRIAVNMVSGDDYDDEGIGRRSRSLASIKRAKEKQNRQMMKDVKPPEKVFREVVIPETITVGELANRMAERSVDVIKSLMKLGVMATITQTIDADTAQLVAEDLKHPYRRVADSDVEDVLKREEDKEEDLISRPPVVTVMGHVDHGKTSLLDALRSSNVAAGEAGGITQHIGAYQVKLPNGQKVTFIDTPGHAAFTAMRARGAKITDIVILVVAANDGIMPQTIEAIHHAKAAGVPIVVAINKIDVPGANPDKVRIDLLQHDVVVESMGGDVLSVEVSAKKRINLDKLVETVLLQAEILNLRANPDALAEGAVVEAKMEKGRGSVATVLIQRGTLKVGDVFVSGSHWGRVRALVNEYGKRVEKAMPSEPVEVLGLQGVPDAGDDFRVVEDETKAREISAYRQRKEREALQVKSARGSMEQMFARIKAGEAEKIPFIIKGDVQGSVEALTGTLEKIANDKVKVEILHAAVGGINESDVTLARVSNAIIIGFNVRANAQARDMAKRDNVEIRYYSVIYDVADEVKKILEGKLAPELKEKIIGYADVRQVFNITKVGRVAGCMVTSGLVKRGAKVRILRDDVVIYTGALKELKRFKDDVKEVREGFDCGLSFDNYEDLKVGDVVECFEVEEIAVHLDIEV